MANFDTNIESMLPGLKVVNGLNSDLPVSFTGTETHSGAVSFTGTVALTNAPTGPAKYLVTKTGLVGATVVLTASQSGQAFLNNSTSGTPVWTLPAPASGLEFTFICGNTTNGMAINTTTASVIHAKTTATGTAITSTATTGAITNTQATAVVGDVLNLVCDGTDWWMVAQSGIFAAS
jgi:hypothetical protein